MIEKPRYVIPTINDIHTLPIKGPWPTKSNGKLNVLFSIDFAEISEKYFNYEESELSKITNNIRGMRSYVVDGLQDNSIGANEWHRIRNELVFAIKGRVKWKCEDAYGDKIEFILDHKLGVWIPPFILHTYETLQDNSELLVFANTLFLADDPATHDAFNATDFQKLQKQYQTT